MKRGFTLIEMLFYLGLLTILLLVVINSMVAIVSSYRNVRSAQVIESSAVAAMDRMTTEIRNAKSISSINADPVGLNSFILLNTASGTPAQIEFDGSTSSLAVYEDGVYSGPLLSRDARLKTLFFRTISTTTSSAIRIELEIESGTGTSHLSKKFYDTAILKATY